jgi:hypothetical protein
VPESQINVIIDSFILFVADVESNVIYWQDVKEWVREDVDVESRRWMVRKTIGIVISKCNVIPDD